MNRKSPSPRRSRPMAMAKAQNPPQESPAGDHPKQLTSTPHNPPKEPQEELHAALKTISEREAASARLKLEQQTLDEARSTVAKLKADHSSRATIFSEVLEAIKKERTSDPSETEVTEISKLIESNASFYKLLGIKQNDDEGQIRKAQKKLVLKIHPDRNKDKAAEKCIKVINSAADALCDRQKRKEHDTFLKNNPPPNDVDTFDEVFAPGAFDKSSDSDDVMEDYGESDSEDDKEENYLRPSNKVQKLHANMGDRIIRPFFKDLDGPVQAAELTKALDRYNKVIMEDNRTNNMPNINMFIDIQALQDYFEKTRRRANPTKAKSAREKFTQGGSRNNATEDVTMQDAGTDDAVYKELGILAHSSSLRRGAQAMGYNGLKYFHDVDGPNKLSVRMAYEVDDAKAKAYNMSNKTSNIQERQGMYRMLDPKDFEGIVGVAFLPETGNNERTCWTYVRAKIGFALPTHPR
ncbi:hypothetical protein DL762_009595 [Monosporascus cannonballus]|uniref:J domain-containing protein n=1 Tax=Monosporascus cannonballus TaxID=155416 RepID=A0ABY0GTE1_9PEZI|nr:hypothetical protein DL762_009595 [Monosporascus cannonballus]